MTIQRYNSNESIGNHKSAARPDPKTWKDRTVALVESRPYNASVEAAIKMLKPFISQNLFMRLSAIGLDAQTFRDKLDVYLPVGEDEKVKTLSPKTLEDIEISKNQGIAVLKELAAPKQGVGFDLADAFKSMARSHISHTVVSTETVISKKIKKGKEIETKEVIKHFGLGHNDMVRSGLRKEIFIQFLDQKEHEIKLMQDRHKLESSDAESITKQLEKLRGAVDKLDTQLELQIFLNAILDVKRPKPPKDSTGTPKPPNRPPRSSSSNKTEEPQKEITLQQLEEEEEVEENNQVDNTPPYTVSPTDPEKTGPLPPENAPPPIARDQPKVTPTTESGKRSTQELKNPNDTLAKLDPYRLEDKLEELDYFPENTIENKAPYTPSPTDAEKPGPLPPESQTASTISADVEASYDKLLSDLSKISEGKRPDPLVWNNIRKSITLLTSLFSTSNANRKSLIEAAKKLSSDLTTLMNQLKASADKNPQNTEIAKTIETLEATVQELESLETSDAQAKTKDPNAAGSRTSVEKRANLNKLASDKTRKLNNRLEAHLRDADILEDHGINVARAKIQAQSSVRTVINDITQGTNLTEASIKANAEKGEKALDTLEIKLNKEDPDRAIRGPKAQDPTARD